VCGGGGWRGGAEFATWRPASLALSRPLGLALPRPSGRDVFLAHDDRRLDPTFDIIALNRKSRQRITSLTAKSVCHVSCSVITSPENLAQVTFSPVFIIIIIIIIIIIAAFIQHPGPKMQNEQNSLISYGWIFIKFGGIDRLIVT